MPYWCDFWCHNVINGESPSDVLSLSSDIISPFHTLAGLLSEGYENAEKP